MKKSKKYPGNSLAVLVGLVALTVLAAELTGCAGRKLDEIPRTPEGPAMDLARELYLRGESLHTLAVRGAVSHEVDRRRTFFRFEALAFKPDRLIFTAFDPAGRPAFRLAAADGRLTGIIYGGRQYFTGTATSENLARFLPLNLTLEQLVALLSGSTAKPAAAGVRALGDNTELILVPAEANGNENEVWRLRLAGGLDQAPHVILAAVRGPASRPNLSLRYLKVQNLPREDKPGILTPFPTSIEAEWTKEKQFIKLVYDEVNLGPALDPELFVLKQPESFEAVFLP
jgi:hypothetical protein